MPVQDILANYVDLTSDPILVGRRKSIDHPTLIEYVNPAFCQIFDRSPEDMIGKPAALTIAPHARDDFYKKLGETLEHCENGVSFDTACPSPDGGLYHVAISLRLFYKPDDSVLIMSTYREINALKKREIAAEAALAEQKQTLELLQSTSERLVSALESYPDPFVIYDKDQTLVICNDAYRRTMSHTPQDIQPGMKLDQILRIAAQDGCLPGNDADPKTLLGVTTHEQPAAPVDIDIELPDDVHQRLLLSRTPNGDHVMIRFDTTSLVRERRAARQSEERLAAAIESYPEPFAIYDPGIRLVTCNRAYQESMSPVPELIQPGMTLQEVFSCGLAHGHFPDAVGQEEEWLERMLSDEVRNTPVSNLTHDGDRHFRVMRSLTNTGDHVVVRIDTTELIRRQRQIEDYANKLESANSAILHEALHDQLTGLGNRRYLNEEFERLSKLRRAHGGELTALHIDLDRFKQINDTLGHAAGDKVLTDVADRVRAKVLDKEIVARIGGDEFVVLLLHEAGSDRPHDLAQDLLSALTRPTVWEGRECRFGASIGMATTPLASEQELLIDSDLALFKAKRGGRGQVGEFNSDDKNEMLRVKHVADDILRALERQEFIPYYQPQVDAKTFALVGIEALARWQHPDKGVLAPDEFINVATELNVLGDIDRQIFDKAIAECAAHFAEAVEPPSLSFNVSLKSVVSADMQHLGRLSRSYPGEVAVELLETIFLEEADTEFMMQIDRFRDMGLSIEVDDFGSGRASVVALQRIAPDRLKIDRQLVAPLEEGTGSLRLVQSIVEIGHALDISVTAEGVETEEQARMLAGLGCDRLQGFLFSRPVPLQELVAKFPARAQPLRVVKG